MVSFCIQDTNEWPTSFLFPWFIFLSWINVHFLLDRRIVYNCWCWLSLGRNLQLHVHLLIQGRCIDPNFIAPWSPRVFSHQSSVPASPDPIDTPTQLCISKENRRQCHSWYEFHMFKATMCILYIKSYIWHLTCYESILSELKTVDICETLIFELSRYY